MSDPFFKPLINKILLLPLLVTAMLLFSGCLPSKRNNGKVRVAAGIPPVAYLASRIGGDRVEVVTVLPEGRTPHDFSSRPKTVREMSQAKLLLSTGMPFEEQLAEVMKSRGEVCDVTAGIKRIDFTDGRSEPHHHHDCGDHGDGDPHVWLSPENAAAMADNITAALCRIDPEGAEIYRKNCAELKQELAALGAQIKKDLQPFEKKTFFVYHPAFGYFADFCNLRQRAVELNGREASAVQQAAIIREARACGAGTIFVQKQFNPRTAEALAAKIGGTVEYLDPLEYDLIANMRKISAALKAGFTRSR